MSESLSLKDPHLLDLNSLVEIAQWILLAAAGGVIGNRADDLLKNIKNRFGKDRLKELENKVYELIQNVQGGPSGQGVALESGLTESELRERIRKLFSEFDL